MRDLLLIALALFTWGIGEGSFFYFQTLYLAELGASLVEIGGILGIAGSVMMVAHIPAGYLADRIGRRKMLWISWSLGLISAWLMALAKTLPLFIAGLLLYALTAFVISPLNSYIAAAQDKWPVRRALTLVSAAYNTGAFLGPLIGGFIGKQYGLQKTYLFAGCVFIISTIVILNIRSQPIEKKDTARKFSLVGNRTYFAYLAVVFLVMFAMYMPQPLTPNFLQDERGLSLDIMGQLGAANSLGNAVLNLLLGQLSAYSGFLLSQISVGLFALFLWQGTAIPWYVIGYFLLGGYRVARTFSIAQVRELIDQSNMGLAFGITETITSVPTMLVPPLAGYISAWNPEAVFPIAIGLLIISLIVSALLTPRPENV
jgi:MFS family permease